MPRYTMNKSTFDRLNGLTPERIAFGYEDDDAWIHDSEASSRWGLDLDEVFRSEGGYAAVLSSLEDDGSHLLMSEYIDMEDPYTPPTPWNRRSIEGMNLSRVPVEWGSRGEVLKYHFHPIDSEGNVITEEIAVEETHSFVWTETQPVTRTDTAIFFRKDGRAHEQQRNRRKAYNTAKKIAEEGKTRRGALIDRCFGIVYGWAASGAMGGDSSSDLNTVKKFGASLAVEIDEFVSLSIDSLRPSISSSSETWLDLDLSQGVSVRNFILSTLDIGY